MRKVSNKFKEAIKKYGRQIDTIISYTDNEGEHLLDSDVLFSVTPTVNGNILKSVMKQLNFESSVKVPKDTIINVKFGVQVDLSLTVAEVHKMKLSRLNSLPVSYLSGNLKGFEYVSLGNYIVSKEPEYNADTLSYSHICYDKMLYSMKDYKKLNITYPITVRDYINKVCENIGLVFKDKNNTFANYNKQIKLDLYKGYDYTFRDILDELAQVTASTICINENTDELEIRYLNNTQDTIDEDYLKDINVKFEEKYGPVNSIVLSRSAESDNVYLQDEDSIEQNGLCELKIIDNQIMNDNDRSDFLPDILEKLNGLNYYINDFSSPGIVWYELCDKYTVSIDGKLYNCVLFNDEIKITQGLEETIYTEIPKVAETDYSKADKTDRKINKAYIIVDKQNQKIEAVVSQTNENSEKLTQVEQTVDSISQKVENIEDLTNTVEGIKSITLENCVEGDLLELHIFGNNTVFDYLYPSDDLFPGGTLYTKGDSRIEVINFPDNSEEGTSEVYELGVTEVLRQNSEVCDEFILEKGQAKVIRRVNKSGSTKAKESTQNLGKLNIKLKDGTNIINIKNYTAKLNAKFAFKNNYTEVFATKVEMNSSITQTAEEINLEVKKKVDENEIISKINQSAEQVSIQAEKISLNGKTLNLADNMAIVSNNFNVDKNGNMICNNAKVTGGKINLKGGTQFDTNFSVASENDESTKTNITPNEIYLTTDNGGIYINSANQNGQYKAYLYNDNSNPQLYLANKQEDTRVKATGITTPVLTQTSLEESKKNFEKLQNGLDIIKNTEIYKYNLKSQADGDKKHIGFVIGKNYKYSNEITALDDKGKEVGVDTYSMISVTYKAIQELLKQNEDLEKRIKELEEK